MVKKLRIGQIMDSLWIVLICLAFGVFMFVKMGPGLVALIKGPEALTAEKELEQMEGKYVSWEVKYPVDIYMETTKTTKVNGVSTGTKSYRSSWLVIDEDRGVCLSIEVPAKRTDEMMAQSDKFFDAMEAETDVTGSGVQVAVLWRCWKVKNWGTAGRWLVPTCCQRRTRCTISVTEAFTGSQRPTFMECRLSAPFSF